VIHPSSIVDPGARVHETAEIGPFCVVEASAVIGEGVRLMGHNTVGAHTTIGRDNVFYPYSTIGVASQDKKYQGEPAETRIGDGNTFREFVTIHRGTAGGGALTEIGDANWVMAYAHIAHDARVGNHSIIGHGVTFAGHVTVEDYANIGAWSGVHQFCRIGKHAMVGGYSVILQDVLPYSITVSEREVKTFAENKIGMERSGHTPEQIAAVHKALRILTRSGLNTTQAIERIREEVKDSLEVDALLEFIAASTRGFIK
jgi:UDP-N-acetylglucosamine acyltransferase